MARPFLALAGAPTVGLTALVRAHLDFAEGAAPARTGHCQSAVGARGRRGGCRILHGAPRGRRPRASDRARRVSGAARPADGRAAGALARAETPAPHIWGQLEARLQHADLLLLGGLNEGTWPALVDPGPWLSGGMRQALGLSPVERRIGLAAHDFVQAACARDVVLSRAEKDAQGNPTVPCRWLVRLETLLAGAGVQRAGTRIGRAWARTLDHVAAARPEPRPAPVPPSRPGRAELSVSDVGLWMKDPYDLYAKRILAARPARGARGRSRRARARQYRPQGAGTLRRAPIRTSCRTTPSAACSMSGASCSSSSAIARRSWRCGGRASSGSPPGWSEQERARRARRSSRSRWRPRALLRLAAPAGEFRLKARADRLERHADGRITVIDYKTGLLPERAEVVCGRAPQLPLEAAMVEAGAFEEVGRAAVAELLYWQLRGDETGGEEQARGRPRPRRARRPGARRTVPADRALRPAADRLSGAPPARRRHGGATTTIWRGAANGPCEPARRSPPAAAHGRPAPRGRADLLDLGDRLGRHRQDAGAGGPGAAPAARRQRSAASCCA